MSKILVTGAAGFLGSHLTELLVKQGYEVKAFIRYNSKNNWGWLEKSDVKNDIEILSGDIRDYDSVFSALKDCNIVFHLAALIGIPYSYVSPLAYIKTNIEGTYNVLQSSKELGLEQVLITSTSEIYGTAQYVPIDEKHMTSGQSPYSATKISADQIATSFYKSFKTPIKIVRPFNIYGPRQSARAIIPSIITQLLSGKTQIEIGNLLPTRDLTYVTDSANGFIEIFKSKRCFGEATNIGMNEEISVKALVNKIVEILELNIEIIEDSKRVRPDSSEVERLRCDNSKLIKNTSWSPKYNLQEGLIETINWLKRNLEFYKTDIYNI